MKYVLVVAAALLIVLGINASGREYGPAPTCADVQMGQVCFEFLDR